jgi:hypothetical protein
MKKYLFFGFLSFFSLVSYAQFQHASLAIGFVSAKMKLETFRYSFVPSNEEGVAGTFNNKVGETFQIPRINVGGEIVSNKFFLFGGTNMSIKIPREIASLDDGQQYKVYEKNVVYMKTALGGGNDVFSFLVGAQYEFNRFQLQGGVPYLKGLNNGSVLSNNQDAAGEYVVDFFGGHQYGISFNVLFAPSSSLALRSSLYIDKTSMNGIPNNVHLEQHFSGSVLTSETALYFYPNPEKNYGLKLSYFYAKRKMNSTTQDLPNYIPSKSSKTNYFNVSLLLNIPGVDVD